MPSPPEPRETGPSGAEATRPASPGLLPPGPAGDCPEPNLPPTGDAAFDAWVGRKLAALYGEILAEPPPAAMLRLLRPAAPRR
ncbi:hypothetical protein JYK14_25470 [Siccirubricoccus sp. KC 17139]|uniref:Anti-sigma factor NepR domain-containing protein n=1 Tax=Siccirubricoccus soli TaxID=2899147 RepID=A0ABT1DC22_9PROT|nr:hypothetical protein [Siccirubricoccus soli]MCO6419488.1 hypothetical protein [Siccirubricoccus soli]MCP2685623.1 hypothetical protein [Siccirubricoccus soli]